MSDYIWREVAPTEDRLGVICLPCLDSLAHEKGLDISDSLVEIQFVGIGKTVGFVPVFIHRYPAKSANKFQQAWHDDGEYQITGRYLNALTQDCVNYKAQNKTLTAALAVIREEREDARRAIEGGACPCEVWERCDLNCPCSHAAMSGVCKRDNCPRMNRLADRRITEAKAGLADEMGEIMRAWFEAKREREGWKPVIGQMPPMHLLGNAKEISAAMENWLTKYKALTPESTTGESQ